MKTDDGATFTTVYLDSQGHYLKFYYAMPGDAVWYVGVDNTTKEDAEVNGYPADLHIANGSEHASALMWTDKNDTAFCISGYFTPDELLKMADSVEELPVSVEETVGEEQLQTPKDYRLTWIPDGCSELMKTDTGGSISTVYIDDQGKYLKFHYITQSQPDETVWYFDVSHTTRQVAEVNGYPADLFIANSAEHASALMWTDKDDTAFCISGYLTPEELFKLADSIEAIEREA